MKDLIDRTIGDQSTPEAFKAAWERLACDVEQLDPDEREAYHHQLSEHCREQLQAAGTAAGKPIQRHLIREAVRTSFEAKVLATLSDQLDRKGYADLRVRNYFPTEHDFERYAIRLEFEVRRANRKKSKELVKEIVNDLAERYGKKHDAIRKIVYRLGDYKD